MCSIQLLVTVTSVQLELMVMGVLLPAKLVEVVVVVRPVTPLSNALSASLDGTSVATHVISVRMVLGPLVEPHVGVVPPPLEAMAVIHVPAAMGFALDAEWDMPIHHSLDHAHLVVQTHGMMEHGRLASHAQPRFQVEALAQRLDGVLNANLVMGWIRLQEHAFFVHLPNGALALLLVCFAHQPLALLVHHLLPFIIDLQTLHHWAQIIVVFSPVIMALRLDLLPLLTMQCHWLEMVPHISLFTIIGC